MQPPAACDSNRKPFPPLRRKRGRSAAVSRLSRWDKRGPAPAKDWSHALVFVVPVARLSSGTAEVQGAALVLGGLV